MADDPQVLEIVEQYLRRQSIIDRVHGLLNDPGRVDLASHFSTVVLSDPVQRRLDSVCADVSTMLRVPMSTASIVDGTNTTVAGAYGIDHICVERDKSYCIFVAASGMQFEIDDTGATPQQMSFLEPYVKMKVRAYLGCPIRVSDQTIGSLCAVDFEPRQWTDLDRTILSSYAEHVNSILEEAA